MAGERDVELFLNAIKAVTVDKGFKLATERAQKALLSAEKLLLVVGSHQQVTKDFVCFLLERVRKCCSHPRAVLCHTFKERMLEKFYKMCVDQEFHSQWKRFIQSTTGMNGTPIFYQYVTRALFEEVIKSQLPTQTGDSTSQLSNSDLDLEECNALRYCGGYLVRSLKKKIEKSICPLKKELLQCLADLTEDHTPDELDDCDDSEKWQNAINRGGLISVSDSMFRFLVQIETELRKHFTPSAITCDNPDKNIKEEAVSRVLGNEDVLFYWEMISFNWVPAESQELLRMIVLHYTVVRGFSFARAFMERYKQASQKTTQKSKGLRKTLNSSVVHVDD